MKILISIILLFIVCSCDPIFRAEINNESKFETVLKVNFDTIELHKNWEGRSYIPFLRSYPNYENISAINFDTINLVKTYIIKSKEIFPLETGTSAPDFALFKTLTLMNGDTLTLRTREEIYGAFKRVDKWIWLLTIK